MSGQAETPPSPHSGLPGTLEDRLAREITRRENAERAAAETEAQLRVIIDDGPDAVLGVDDGGRISLVNVAAERMFGYARSELVGQPIEIVVPARLGDAHVAQRRKFMTAPLARPMGSALQLAALRKSGAEFPVEISLGIARLSDGVMVMAAVRDVSDRKLAEQRETTMLRSLAAIGESSALLAHEIKNPLTAVNAALKVVASRLGIEEEEVLADLVDRLRRVEMMMRRTLSFTKPLDTRPSLVLVKDLIAGGVHDAEAALAAAEVTTRVDVAPEDLAVAVDPDFMREVVMNLVVNAAEAAGVSGAVTISARADAGAVQIEVADSGPGIPPSIRATLFKPFVTTKRSGTGLGLAICQKIVEHHGGTIAVRDVRPHGTCVVVRLPQPPAGASLAPGGLRTTA